MIRKWQVAAACALLAVGSYLMVRRAVGHAESDMCGDLRYRGNIITPYGVTIVDCTLAQDVAEKFVSNNRISVRASTECWLSRSGMSAEFECNEDLPGNAWNVGMVVNDGDRPTRDSMGRISAIIWSRTIWGRGLNYHVLLLEAGAATVSDECLKPTLPVEDYCHYLRGAGLRQMR